MDKQKQVKKQIRIEINNLLDYKCGPCSIAACSTCDVKVQLNKLSDMLETTVRPKEVVVDPAEIKTPKRPRRYELDVFFDLFDKGLMNIQVERALNVTDRTVVKKRKEWKEARGITYKEPMKNYEHYKQRVDLKHAEYVKLFEKGLTYSQVMKKLNVSKTTAYRHYKQWEAANNV